MIIYDQKQNRKKESFFNAVYNKEIQIHKSKYDAMVHRLRDEVNKNYKYCHKNKIGKNLYFSLDGSFGSADSNEMLPSHVIIYHQIKTPCAPTVSDEDWQRILEMVTIYYPREALE